MFITSIILTAAALYLLTYGGRTSIEKTVVARDAITEHYVTPYYKIESVSDDRGVPNPEAPDPNPNTVQVLELDDTYQYVSNPDFTHWAEIDPALMEIERSKLKDMDVAAVQSYADKIGESGTPNIQMSAVVDYAEKHNVDMHWGNRP